MESSRAGRDGEILKKKHGFIKDLFDAITVITKSRWPLKDDHTKENQRESLCQKN